MNDAGTPLASVLVGLAMPELGATREAIQSMASASLDAYLSVETDEAKRTAALALQAALASWTSPDLTREIAEAAQALLVVLGHGGARESARKGAAWMQVITLINDLAHPESHAISIDKVKDILLKLDAYLAFLAEEPQRAAALAMRGALVAWTTPEQPEAVTEAARAMLVAEGYETLRAELRKLCGLP